MSSTETGVRRARRTGTVARSAAAAVRPKVLVGVISDTHGLLRTAALETLRGADHLIHAGDVGAEEILERLSGLAPLTAVRGNVDRANWTDRLPATTTVEIAGVGIHVVHDVHDLRADEMAAARVVVSGHSHQPSIREADGVLYLNPGSAGPRRFKLPVCIALLEIGPDGTCAARLVELPG